MRDIPRHRRLPGVPLRRAIRRGWSATAACGLISALLAAGCTQPPEPSPFRQAGVDRGDIIVSVEAAGVIRPALTVELKSKASGEVLEIHAETGDYVEAGTLLVEIDQRVPRNQLAQAEAELEAARARRAIARAQNRRSERLFEDGIINEVEFEQTQLELANATSDLVRAEVALENARIQLGDTNVTAPTAGTIIERLVERGQVISSPTMDVGGGTLLLTMAELDTVEVQTMVDETDIGKISSGQTVEVGVTAFPNLSFEGKVRKVEPQAMEEQTVTTFAVLVRLDNRDGWLRPGMNAEVRIIAAESRDVLRVPTMALRTLRDIRTSAGLVGLEEDEVRAQLAANRDDGTPAGQRLAMAGGDRTGVPAARYWVFRVTDNGPVATWVDTGLTDLDVSEVLSGLHEGDRVLLLPSSGLVEAQQRLQERMRQFQAIPGLGR